MRLVVFVVVVVDDDAVVIYATASLMFWLKRQKKEENLKCWFECKHMCVQCVSGQVQWIGIIFVWSVHDARLKFTLKFTELQWKIELIFGRCQKLTFGSICRRLINKTQVLSVVIIVVAFQNVRLAKFSLIFNRMSRSIDHLWHLSSSQN